MAAGHRLTKNADAAGRSLCAQTEPMHAPAAVAKPIIEQHAGLQAKINQTLQLEGIGVDVQRATDAFLDGTFTLHGACWRIRRLREHGRCEWDEAEGEAEPHGYERAETAVLEGANLRGTLYLFEGWRGPGGTSTCRSCEREAR